MRGVGDAAGCSCLVDFFASSPRLGVWMFWRRCYAVKERDVVYGCHTYIDLEGLLNRLVASHGNSGNDLFVALLEERVKWPSR